jgi:ankyrin repeat protein
MWEYYEKYSFWRVFRMKKAGMFIFIILLFLALPGFDIAARASELSRFCTLGDVSAVRRALRDGANPNEVDEAGGTPLFYTVRAGVESPLSMHVRIAAMLIEAGANVDVGFCPPFPVGDPADSLSPLHLALTRGESFAEVILFLLERGADPNLPGAQGRPLHVAARTAALRPEQLALLLEHGANVHLPNQRGVGPLVEAVTCPAPSVEKAALLLDAGADVNEVFDLGDQREISVLMAAAANGPPELIRLLLDRGARKFERDAEDLTALDYALAADRLENAELLR